jgi:hypothetical protein
MKAYKKLYDDSVVEFAFLLIFIIIFRYIFSFLCTENFAVQLGIFWDTNRYLKQNNLAV